ncbi:MAG: EF-P lysine aminoacylase GenX [Gammaproteobacteria bacterium RIFCSPHIGHO2_12_FULL_38_14]|nr:MAG: EF-P lysine aminoacylase GenX [Gammaproteobacteria bacterium RIFCSPHIGHO2_12_FULL_38_14]
MNWLPSADIETLKLRAKLLQNIRDFFNQKKILEVETPLLSYTSVTDPFIASIKALVADNKSYYLQTSPEYAMKRLLAAGSGSIYQITKAFRQGELGRFHNPEFTMLEWYRIDFDHHQLMDEVDELLRLTLRTQAAEKISYAELFQTYLKIDPHHATLNELKITATNCGLVIHNDIHDQDTWLNLLMSHCIEPQLGFERPCMIYDFPASQAALARIQASSPKVASRFEVYIQGIELANGFHELQNAAEQRERFENNLQERKQQGLPSLAIDENFLAALQHGLPDCAGVALGIDRLMMLAAKKNTIAEILSFDFKRA